MGDSTPVPARSGVSVFRNDSWSVRTATIDGDPWFVARDVCDALGIADAKSSLRLLDEDEKGVHSVHTPGGAQQMAVVNEPGLYSLILRSRKPEAKAFKRWITHDVLPSIRRSGTYAVEQSPATFQLPQTMAEALRLAADQCDRADMAEAKVAELAPAAAAWETLASAEGDYSVGDSAKILSRDPAIKIGQNRLFKFMGAEGWLFRGRGDNAWRVSQRAIERLVASEIPQTHYHPRTGELIVDPPQVRVTAKGLRELHRLLGGAQAPVAELTTGGAP